MWDFKKCPRCRGDIFVDEDIDNSYVKCLQCGYEREMAKVSVSRYERELLKVPASRKSKKAEKEPNGVR
jgi:DNA-directed RNA polymerase subunit M/transcription elongation factor TFIIS